MTHQSQNRHQLKVNALARLLELIDEVNQDIEASQDLKNDLLVKQYKHLKKDYTQQLLELLEDYDLPLYIEDAA